MKFEVDSPGFRLDLFLSVKTKRSRSYVKEQLQKGRVQLNGQAFTKASQILKVGDEVSVEFSEQPPLMLSPVAMALDILYEDKDLIVLNKEQGWVVHPAITIKGDTVVHYLLHYLAHESTFKETSPLRPGIVHRLDRGTSGCLIVAKNRTALEKLSKQFKDRVVEKEYEAMVWGKTKAEFTVKTAIGRHRTDRKRMSSKTLAGREALTRFRTIQTFGEFSHVLCLPKTGRTHQLRVHLCEQGNPIVGDTLYGRKRDLRDLVPPIQDFLKTTAPFTFLHAKSLSFLQPTTGEKIRCEAKRPASFDQFLSVLESVK